MNDAEKAYAAALAEQFRLGDIATDATRALRAAEDRRTTLGYLWRTAVDDQRAATECAYREAQEAVPALEAAAAEATANYLAAQPAATELAAHCPRGVPKSRPGDPWRGRRVRGF